MDGSLLVAVSVLLLALFVDAQAPQFQTKVNIPYALQSSSKVIEPGEYVAGYKREGGQRVLTLQTLKGDLVLRTTAEGAVFTPKEERNFAGSFRVRITRVPDQKSREKHWIVFDWDYKVGPYFWRVTFRVPEAAKTSFLPRRDGSGAMAA